jgi:hypothetical protein
MVPIRDGDFVVTQERWGTEVKQAIKITEFYIYHRTGTGGDERRMRRDDIVFSGPEAVARKLAEQLTSSAAQGDEEMRSSRLRRMERDKAFIAKANAATADAEA